MKLYDILEKQLKKEKLFIDENGKLKKWVVINKAQNFDATLIELLLNNKELKEKFFVEVKNSWVFNLPLFVQFLEQKKYFNDSYTRYKNKIGLTIDGKYLNQRNEIVLAWPYKDCVLEGGQSKEEQQREELFLNEILAQDEITQLFEPKVITNPKKYTSKGTEKFKHFNRDKAKNIQRNLPENTITDNLLIKGNNLIALHTIRKEFAGKIKLIYIDPPYNTGGDANIFTYNNRFNHSTWLTFMKNRLTIARDFLTKNGFIAIAIDHYELGYLITLADEIFGRENRIAIISVVNNPMGRNQAKFFSTVNDFMVVYAKQIELAQFNNIIVDKEFLKSFDREDKYGKYKLKNFIRVGGGNANLRKNKASFWYPIYVSQDLKKLSLQPQKNYTRVFPVTSTGQERTWKLSPKSTAKILNHLVAVQENDKIVIYEKYRIDKGQKIPTVWSDKKYNANHQGIRLLEKIIGRKTFSYPKSLYTVIDTIKLMTRKDDIIMDFFAGSGTTGHAVLAINEEEKSNRQFILIEQLDTHIDICIERNHNILQQKKSEASFTYFELKKYNQIFVEKIQKAKSTKELLKIWQEIKEKSFMDYQVDIQKHEKYIDAFKKLNKTEQKQILLEMLDKNQLYVNLSSLYDEDFDCSKDEIHATRDFYNL